MLRFYQIDARIARPRLIAGIAVAVPIVWAGTIAARSGAMPVVTAAGAGAGMLLAKLLVEAARRLHDTGRPASVLLALLVIAMIGVIAGYVDALGTGAWFVPWIAVAVFANVWCVILLRAGTPDANRYGLPPSRWRPSFGDRGGAGVRFVSPGLVLAGMLMLAGGALGYGGARWVEGLAGQRRIDEQAAARIAATPADTPGDRQSGDALEAEYQEPQQ